MEAVKGCGSQRPEAEPGVHQGGQGRRALPKGELITLAKATFKQVKQSKSCFNGARETTVSIAVQLKERLRMERKQHKHFHQRIWLWREGKQE